MAIPDFQSIMLPLLRPSLAAFFRAYASGRQDELGYYAAPGVAFSGLGAPTGSDDDNRED